jgi:hypothetical protein
MRYLQKELSKQKEAHSKYFTANISKKRQKIKKRFMDKFVNFSPEAQNKSIDNK